MRWNGGKRLELADLGHSGSWHRAEAPSAASRAARGKLCHLVLELYAEATLSNPGLEANVVSETAQPALSELPECEKSSTTSTTRSGSARAPTPRCLSAQGSIAPGSCPNARSRTPASTTRPGSTRAPTLLSSTAQSSAAMASCPKGGSPIPTSTTRSGSARAQRDA